MVLTSIPLALKQLASSLKKSRRIIGRYAIEVRAKGVCKIRMGRNQFARTVFEVCEDYWPYVREGNSPTPQPDSNRDADGSVLAGDSGVHPKMELDASPYIETVRHTYLALGCTRGVFRSADAVIARSFFSRGISLAVLTDALVVGAVRKYVSWLNGNTGEAIAGLKYFDAVVDEILENPLPSSYREYVRGKLKQLQERWLVQSRRLCAPGKQSDRT